MAGLSSGELDREITLQVGTPGDGSVESGEVTMTWAAVTDEVNASGYVDAQWLPAGTREAWQAQQRLGAYVDGVYRIQYRSTLPTPSGYRVIGHDGRVYDVKGIIEGGRQEWLDLSVIATDAEGDVV
jgi:hypothetical protein